jgi:hypothetical protein
MVRTGLNVNSSDQSVLRRPVEAGDAVQDLNDVGLRNRLGFFQAGRNRDLDARRQLPKRRRGFLSDRRRNRRQRNNTREQRANDGRMSEEQLAHRGADSQSGPEVTWLAAPVRTNLER